MQRGDGVRIEAVAGIAALDPALDQAGVLQDPEVLRDGRLSERHHLHDLATHAPPAIRQRPQDRQPRRVREGLELLGQRLVHFIVHRR